VRKGRDHLSSNRKSKIKTGIREEDRHGRRNRRVKSDDTRQEEIRPLWEQVPEYHSRHKDGRRDRYGARKDGGTITFTQKSGLNSGPWGLHPNGNGGVGKAVIGGVNWVN